MEGNILIDNLLSYAVNRLYLSELDLQYKKSVLCTVLNVRNDFAIQISQDVKIEKLVEDLKCFLKENNVVYDDVFSSIDYIFGLIMPSPSIIDRSFKTIREKFGAQKAFSYFYNLSQDCCFLSSLDKNFIEYDGKNYTKTFLKKYPSSFVFNEQKNSLNECKIALEFAGDTYTLIPSRVAIYPYQATLKSKNNFTFFLNENTFETMFSFVEYSPDFFISPNVISDSKECLSDKYFIGKTDLVFFNSKPYFSAKHELYPDVEIYYTDWCISTLRLVSYNKNTLINSALDIVNAWKNYSDEENLKLQDEYKRFVNVFVSMLNDGRYEVDIVLRNDREYCELDLDKSTDSQFFEKSYANSSVLGLFMLNKNFDAINNFLIKVLTTNQNIKDLPVLSQFVDTIIHSYGVIKDAQKACL